MPEGGFLIFWSFFYFFQNFLFRVEYERNSGLNFFSLFLGLSHPVMAKNNEGKWFFKFLNFFCYLFLNFLAEVEYKQNSGLKFFSPSLGLSHPVLAKKKKKKCWKEVFWFFEFFCYFFRNFLAQIEYERNSGQNFFFLYFSAYLMPFG